MSAHAIHRAQAADVPALYQVGRTLRACYASVDGRAIPAPVSKRECAPFIPWPWAQISLPGKSE